MIEKSTHIANKISSEFKKWNGTFPQEIIQLPNSGSNRIYYRVKNNNQSFVAAFNNNKNENTAFFDFTNQLLKARINVSDILYSNISENIYFLTDLGNVTLLDWLHENKEVNHFSSVAIEIYKKVIRELVKMQIVAGRNFNYKNSYPHKTFDKNSIIFDLKYFKNHFLNTTSINYNKQELEKEFIRLADYLLSEDHCFFMYRDFQARNIMLLNQEPFFIDYQGGRQGALQYDLASLLFQAKAQIPETVQTELLHYYIEVARLFIPINLEKFTEYFYAFAWVRVLQTLGAYGLRGIVERKAHFLESIPFAINNLKKLGNKVSILNQLPELKKITESIILTDIHYVNSKHK